MTAMSLFFIFSTILMMISSLSMKTPFNKEKLFSFECGFNPFFSPQSAFSIQFFKILMIFLLFDMEIIVILPLPMFQTMNYYSTILTMIILLFIIAGLFFEWKEGSLEWLK